MTTIRPKKALGQHFLIDDSIAARIADTLADYRGQPVLEVGPGTGVLTRHLLATGHDLSVVEIDPASISFLRTHYPALEGRILDEDFLQMDLRTRYPSDFMVIGNYPYYISSQIFFKVLEERDRVVCCSGMIQKEVAERLAARPGPHSALVRRGIPLHRPPFGLQSAAQGAERRGAIDTQRSAGAWLRRTTVQDGRQDGLQPPSQDTP